MAGIVVAIMEGARNVLKTIHLCVLSLIVLLEELITVVIILRSAMTITEENARVTMLVIYDLETEHAIFNLLLLVTR